MSAESYCATVSTALGLCFACCASMCLCTACREALRGDKSTSPVDVTFLTRWAPLEREDEVPATAVGYPAVDWAPAPIWTRPSPVSWGFL